MNRNIILLNALLAITTFASCQYERKLTTVVSADAPKAIGPYSQAVVVGKTVYCSGQIGLSPATNAMAGSDIATQTHQALKNLKAVLVASGSDLDRVVKVTVYLKDLNDFAQVNDIYKDYFPTLKPARSTVQVARLPKDAMVEIDCIAQKK